MKIVKKLLNRINKKKYKVKIKRFDITNDKEYSRGIKKIMNLLNYTKKSLASYSAGNFDSGYHSFKIDNYKFKGQRDPELRFKDLPFSLDGLSVLDIGCNQGGMLYAFSDVIKYGIGIDYDSRMINVANKLRSYSNTNNIDYYVFDLENEDLNYINDFLPDKKVDVVLLLSICMWINNWRDVISFSAKISEKMIFESNGNIEEQEIQVVYLKEVYQHVQLIHSTSEDDPSQKMRKLYYCC